VSALETFRQSLGSAAPPANLGPALEALWWVRRGDWEKAHQCVQGHEGVDDCDRVHAHLHRQEGDMSNAGWWYRKVGRPVPKSTLEEEWDALAAELLKRS
jgi:hypothetical protein